MTNSVAAPTRPAIEISGLSKLYGSFRALDGIDIDVPEGSIFGFLGPNGAGKTTTLRIITGLAGASSGTVRILGKDARDSDTRSSIGYLPDVPGFYPWMNAEEFLRFSGGLFGLTGSRLDDRVKVLLALAGLEDVKTRVGGYSRGMKQRLGVAQALINAPRLLLLDEPTSALDPLGRKEVLDMILSLRGRTTVFFSTHILADVERVCDTVAILDHGKVVTQASIDELKSRYGAHRIVIELDSEAEMFAEELRGLDWVTAVQRASDGGLSVSVTDPVLAGRAIPALVAARGLGLRRFEGGEIGLEEVFVDLVGGDRR